MKALKTLKENSYSLLLVLTIFAAIFSTKSIPFFLVSLLLLWIFNYKDFSNFKNNIKWIMPFFLYVFIVVISFFFADNYASSVKILEKHISFVILPIIIFFKKWTQKEVYFFAYFFIRITLLVAVFSIINLLYFYATHVDFVKTMDDTYLQWKLPHLNGFHPTYLGFVIVAANIILLKSASKKKFFKNNSFYTALFLSFFLLYISPRTPSVCLLIVWFCFLFNYFKAKKDSKTYLFIFLGLIIIALTASIFSSQYLIDKILKSYSDQRIILWKHAIILIKENSFFFGEGLGNGEVLLENYITKNKLNQFEVPDLHNQYLMNYLDLGIFGVISLCWMLFKPVQLLKDKTLLLFSVVFSLAIFTESYLVVIKGIIIFIILMSYFIISSNRFKLNDKK